MTPDHINALFELCGAIAVFLSVLRTYKAKEMVGISGVHVGFFFSWGVWNLYYYPDLDQMWSFAAGVLLTGVNLVFAILWLKYGRKAPSVTEVEKVVIRNGLTQSDVNRLTELAAHFRYINSRLP